MLDARRDDTPDVCVADTGCCSTDGDAIDRRGHWSACCGQWNIFTERDAKFIRRLREKWSRVVDQIRKPVDFAGIYGVWVGRGRWKHGRRFVETHWLSHGTLQQALPADVLLPRPQF